ncbi:Lipid phosphate phosphohydrolase 2, partial [Caligus rogercresseyi]
YQAYHPGMCRLSEGGGVSFTGKDVLDSLRSFPSGHAQTGFFSAIVALFRVRFGRRKDGCLANDA